MSKKELLRNPVLRGNETVNGAPLKSVCEEIGNQDLSQMNGGTTVTTTTATTVTLTPTPFLGCGNVYTVSAECSANGTPCA